MTQSDLFIQSNLNNIRNLVIFATLVLAIVLIQKLKPGFSISGNSNPAYLKARLIAKLILSGVLYTIGLYWYIFADLTQKLYNAPLIISCSGVFYHVLKWGLTKIIEHRDNRRNYNDERV